MPTIKKFEDLEIWKLARDQAKNIYAITRQDSFLNDVELKNHINKSAGSVMDNIAEGFERFTTKEFIQFLVIAKGSNGEVRSQLYRAFDRQHITVDQLNDSLAKSELAGYRIMAFIKYLQNSGYKTKPSTPNFQLPT